jgi:archaellum component FlaF (FlaF/FlaG flagellin family)
MIDGPSTLIAAVFLIIAALVCLSVVIQSFRRS